MLPEVAVRFGSHHLPLPSYGVMMILAFGVALAILARSRRLTMAGWRISGLSIAVGAVVCRYLAPLLTGAAPGAGSAFFAWAVPSFICFVILCRAFGVPALGPLDAILPVVLLASAIGRVGCLLGGCCHGLAADPPLGWHMPGATMGEGTYIPTQALHGVADLIAFLLTSRIGPSVPGTRSLAATGLYLGERFAIGFLRAENRICALTHGQIAAGLCILCWLPAFVRWRMRCLALPTRAG